MRCSPCSEPLLDHGHAALRAPPLLPLPLQEVALRSRALPLAIEPPPAAPSLRQLTLTLGLAAAGPAALFASGALAALSSLMLEPDPDSTQAPSAAALSELLDSLDQLPALCELDVAEAEGMDAHRLGVLLALCRRRRRLRAEAGS